MAVDAPELALCTLILLFAINEGIAEARASLTAIALTLLSTKRFLVTWNSLEDWTRRLLVAVAELVLLFINLLSLIVVFCAYSTCIALFKLLINEELVIVVSLSALFYKKY